MTLELLLSNIRYASHPDHRQNISTDQFDAYALFETKLKPEGKTLPPVIILRNKDGKHYKGSLFYSEKSKDGNFCINHTYGITRRPAIMLSKAQIEWIPIHDNS